MNVDLTKLHFPSEDALSAAIEEAGVGGSITLNTAGLRSLRDNLARRHEEENLRDLAADLLKSVVLQGAARAAIPVLEDVRSLVRLARVLYDELETPTPWPVPAAEPDDEE